MARTRTDVTACLCACAQDGPACTVDPGALDRDAPLPAVEGAAGGLRCHALALPGAVERWLWELKAGSAGRRPPGPVPPAHTWLGTHALPHVAAALRRFQALDSAGAAQLAARLGSRGFGAPVSRGGGCCRAGRCSGA
jgi:hypothetical protein